MKTLRNEEGAALVTALLMTLISLGIVMSLLILIQEQTRHSGAHKRYKNALEASHGAVELMAKELIPLMFSGGADPKSTLTTEFASINLDTASNACLQQKLTLPASGWTACGASSKSLNPKLDSDLTFKLQGTTGSGFNVYAKIVDTQPGNSDTSGLELDSGAGVTGTSSGVSPKHIPAMYRLETEGESADNPKEKAALTVLYAY